MKASEGSVGVSMTSLTTGASVEMTRAMLFGSVGPGLDVP